ncbi:MAG: family 20 glycosylhydrolase [Ignavibacteriaceae bacterium]
MKLYRIILPLILTALIGCSSIKETTIAPKGGEKWKGIHLLGYSNDSDLVQLGKIVPTLSSMGINVIVLEVDYNFQFQSHPELRYGIKQITRDGARTFANICIENNIELIPEFQCLGHQSWAQETYPLLTKYPQFDLTPGAFPGNKDIYCREWDLTNPELYKIVFSLLDEIIDAFQAKAFHAGMDEVFLLGSDKSPSTQGKDPGKLFAKAVNDIYDHLVKKRGIEMLMWADRLIDGYKFNFGEWESSMNGTASAIDMIPKDIILCPWHYEKMESYPSIPYLIDKGFRVLPSSWKDADAAKALIDYSNEQRSPKMLGHLFTTWRKVDLLNYPPLVICIGMVGNQKKLSKK